MKSTTKTDHLREGSNNDRVSCLPVIVALAIFWGFVGLLIYFGI